MRPLTRTIDVKLLTPHSAQQELMIEHPGSGVYLCGRRFGKTDSMVQRLFRQAAEKPGLYWWVGLSWQSASMRRAWRVFHRYALSIYRGLGINEAHYVNKSNRTIIIPGLIELWFRTAENPASLAGEGVMGVVLDEFTLMQEIVWVEYVEATLLDHAGWAALAGVPKGMNWGAKLFRQAERRDGWVSVRAPSSVNPYIDHARLADIKANTHELYWRQEYEAEIVSDAGEVFKSITEICTAARLATGEYGKKYVYGVDWGKSTDYTVVSIFDVFSGRIARQVALERWNNLDYDLQLARLLELTRRFTPHIMVVETNAMGEPLADFLSNTHGLPIQRVFTDNRTKNLLIEALILATEQRTIQLIADDQQVAEFQSMQRIRTRTGRFTSYEASAGEHDDIVMSDALALSALSFGAIGEVAYG